MCSPDLALTAVIAATDRNALGLLEALRERGVAVPRDIAVIGFDDMESAWHHDPPLSPRRVRAQLNHEYVHVLQYRADGMWRFYWRYLRSLVMALFKRCTVWEISPYERIGVEIETLYLEHPELPNLWELVEDARDASVR